MADRKYCEGWLDADGREGADEMADIEMKRRVKESTSSWGGGRGDREGIIKTWEAMGSNTDIEARMND